MLNSPNAPPPVAPTMPLPAGGDASSTANVAPASPQTTAEDRGLVQRKLGRCILRLQQYEMLSKAILVEHEQSGSISNWEARRQARIEKFSRMTLGMLVSEMKTSWLAKGEAQGDDDESDAPADLTEIWVRTRSRMQMDPAEYERTIAAMEALVAMRNELVHHFLPRFNLWDTSGCADADRFLEQSYQVIDRHMDELTAWARHMDETRQHMAHALASDEIQDVLFGSRAETAAEAISDTPALPDYARVCSLLREAEAACAIDGWVLLDDAIPFIDKASKSTEFPSRYGCRKWRQVLSRSGAFDIEDRTLPERSGIFTAYRSRPTPTDSMPAASKS